MDQLLAIEAGVEPLTAAAAPPPRRSRAAPIPTVVNDAVDAATAEHAPATFSTTDAAWAASEARFQEGLAAGRFDEDAASLAAEREILPASVKPAILPSSVTVKCGTCTWEALDAQALARGSSWFANALSSGFREAATRVFEFPFDKASGGAHDTVPLAGLRIVIAWLSSVPPTPDARLGARQLCESGDELVAATRAAHFLGADALLAELEDVLAECARDQTDARDDGGACTALLALADELRLAKLRTTATTAALGLLERCERQAFFADQMDPDARAQLARVRALRDASAREGLGALGLPDAREYVAMLREALAERRERYEEARALAAHDDAQLRARLKAGGVRRAPLGVASVDAFADDAGRRTAELLAAQAERIEAFARYVDTQEAVFASELESWGPVRKREAAPCDLAHVLLDYSWPALTGARDGRDRSTEGV